MAETGKIECGKHGKMNSTYVCNHLVKGENLGFNLGYDPENEDDLHPDAWCDKCEELLDKEGEWNDKSAAFADIKVLCSGCYENSRERNWKEDTDAFHELIKQSLNYLSGRQSSFMDTYKVSDYDRWDWVQEKGQLIFSNEGKPVLEADIHFVGTYSKSSKSWRWAWANSSLLEKVKSGSHTAKELGEDNNYMKLVAAQWQGEEVDGWEMTAILAKLSSAIGAYRTPSENGFTYMVVTNAKWVD